MPSLKKPLPEAGFFIMNKPPKPVNRKNLFRRFAGVDELDFVYHGTGEKIKRFVITRPDAAAILI